MKNTIKMMALGLMTSVASFAQNFEGTVVYSRTMDPSKMFNNNQSNRMNQMGGNWGEQMRRPSYFTLAVKNNEFSYKPSKAQESEEITVNINGEQRSFRRPQQKNEAYYNLDTKKFNKYEEYAQQPFNVSGEITEIRWKVDPTATKTILGYECMKATYVEQEKRTMPKFVNEKMSFVDTVINNQITVWFTDQLSSSAGPDKYFGLPGLILEVDMNDGATITTAAKVEAKKVEDADIKINSKGKKMTVDQFEKMKKDHQAEQNRNMRGQGGGGMMIMRGN